MATIQSSGLDPEYVAKLEAKKARAAEKRARTLARRLKTPEPEEKPAEFKVPEIYAEERRANPGDFPPDGDPRPWLPASEYVEWTLGNMDADDMINAWRARSEPDGSAADADFERLEREFEPGAEFYTAEAWRLHVESQTSPRRANYENDAPHN